MCAIRRPPPDALAALLMSAADALVAPGPDRGGAVAPLGLPVRHGRLALGRLREALAAGADRELQVAAGFQTAAWIGRRGVSPPRFGRLVWTAVAVVDRRARVTLGHRACAYLAVADPTSFEVVPLRASGGGLLFVPVDGFEQRLGEIEP